MRVEVYFEPFLLWDAIIEIEIQRKKDRQALSVIFGAIFEDLLVQLHTKKICEGKLGNSSSVESWS